MNFSLKMIGFCLIFAIRVTKIKLFQMAVEIRTVSSRKDLKAFVDFPVDLFKDMPSYVPGLSFDEMDTLDSSKNPVYEFCESKLFLAYKDGRIAGRVAAILNKKANEAWNHKEIRYGWLDFIDDKEVSSALMDAVAEYGKSLGMTEMSGPLGFTDFDPEGMLIEGFEHLSTMALRHSFPYYKNHMEAMGFEKEIDWLEYKVTIPAEIPEKYQRVSSMVAERYKLHIRKITRKDVKKLGLGYKIFDLVNETYSKLYNFTILPKKVVDSYVDLYLGLLDLKFITVVEDENGEMVGFGISMPSITRALQKCKGRIFPLGWFYILRSMYFKYEDNVELMLLGVKPEYQKRGVNALIFTDLIKRFQKAGFKYAETNAELETNLSMSSLWGEFDFEQTKRRRIYKKELI